MSTSSKPNAQAFHVKPQFFQLQPHDLIQPYKSLPAIPDYADYADPKFLF